MIIEWLGISELYEAKKMPSGNPTTSNDPPAIVASSSYPKTKIW